MNFEKSRQMQLRARVLRNNPTKEENHLWYDFLSKYPVRFNRQKNIGAYIVDFYCHKAALVVEIDGLVHWSEMNEEYDENRNRYLESYGLKVLHFDNRLIWNDFSYVCSVIDENVRERLK